MITRTGLHAIRALVILARLPEGEYAGAAHIAKTIDGPQNYLSKLLKSFVAEGLVSSQKGLHGGFRLAQPASKITLFHVLDPIEQISKWSGCILGHGDCKEVGSCTIHDEWKKVRDGYMRMLKRTTIADLVSRETEILNSLNPSAN